MYNRNPKLKNWREKTVPKEMKVGSMERWRSVESWSGEVERRIRRSQKEIRETLIRSERESERERERDRETEKRERERNVVRGIGEWDFVGDSLSPAVFVRACWFGTEGARLPRNLRGTAPGGVYGYVYQKKIM